MVENLLVRDYIQAMSAKIKIKLENILGGKVLLDDFLRALTSLKGLAELFDKEIHSEKTMDLVVSDLAFSSACATIEAKPRKKRNGDKAALVIKTIKNGISSVSRGISKNISFRALEILKNMVGVIKTNTRLTIDNEEVPASVKSFVENIMKPSITAIGSIQGSLDIATVRKANRFTIFDDQDRKTDCFFQDQDLEKVRISLGKNVRVAGEINYREDGTPLSIRVSDIIPVEEPKLVKIEDFIGIWSISEKSEDYIRRIRDGE